MIFILFIRLLFLTAQAEVFPTNAEVFPIMEEDLQRVLEKRLRCLEESGALGKHQKKVEKILKEKVKRPRPVLRTKATHKQSYLIDPSFIVDRDMYDPTFKVWVKFGTNVNPLKYMSLSKLLIFIDGDDKDQVKWALSQEHAKIILTNGEPLTLAKIYKRPFFFDQHGFLIQKLNITALPAKVVQDKLFLRVSIEVVEGGKP